MDFYQNYLFYYEDNEVIICIAITSSTISMVTHAYY